MWRRGDKRQGDQISCKPESYPSPETLQPLVNQDSQSPGNKDSLLVTLWDSGDRKVTITDNAIYTNIADSDCQVPRRQRHLQSLETSFNIDELLGQILAIIYLLPSDQTSACSHCLDTRELVNEEMCVQALLNKLDSFEFLHLVIFFSGYLLHCQYKLFAPQSKSIIKSYGKEPLIL